MPYRLLMSFAGLAAIAACGEVEQTPEVPPIPEAVVAVAAPDQDLFSAQLLPSDNCYWYSYAGPVETTLLPLRTVNGNPICAAQPADS